MTHKDTDHSSKYKVDVEIGIPAFNEEANIQTLLTRLSTQETVLANVKAIYVISDGSSDGTVEKARALKIDNVIVVDSADRLGKSKRMRELFDMATTDCLILLDADVLPESNTTIEEIARPIIYGAAQLTSGKPMKMNTGTFADKVMGVSQYMQDYIKENYRDGDSVYACHGRIVGLHRSLFSKLKLPTSSTGNDAFLYFFNKRQKQIFQYCPNAVVRFKMPQSYADFLKQRNRFSGTLEEQAKVFGHHIYDDYKIPKILMLRSILSALLVYHIYAVVYILWKVIPARKGKKQTEKWDVSASTKKII